MDNKEYLERLGRRIVELRKEKGIKQVELSYKIDIDYSALSRIENGRVNTTIVMLRKIAEGLEVDLLELLDF